MHQGAVDVHVAEGGGDHGHKRGSLRMALDNDSSEAEGGAEARSKCWQLGKSH